MNVKHHRRQQEHGRSRRFALGLVGTAGMAVVLLVALYAAVPPAHRGTPDHRQPTGATGGAPALLSSGTGTNVGIAGGTAAAGVGSMTFHEDADLRRLAPEPDPSAAAVAAY
jgi:hypothetical protein